ncbi:DUF2336 domain-containing protein [Bradyrhizobium ontarionense]|uniref:DUF2336 domain-containing protein n=1 Tax=Bradyrhizobium ontarionense TaxID=2898149 RepID=A0ABY3RHK2_9BRAD|nr:DUF2336 domain-containing protein [Bradyrhizobium sp. A19]UFZ06134.1 DUF2336 domain-containing protein [Bradyrhizobium sp. A19]
MPSSVLHQLEDILASRYVSRRAEILERVTDLFVVGSGKFTEEHVDLFDHVLFKLLDNVAAAARAELGSRLAVLPDAPPHLIRHLASDETIAVAGPVLRQSERLDEQTLVATAQSRSQDHLLAISGRRILTEAVTDVLVDRGDQAVVSNTANNGGARFSDMGFSGLVTKASDDAGLALSLWGRPDSPREVLVRLFVEASDAVRNQLATADSTRAEILEIAVAQASDRLQASARTRSADFANAKAYVELLQASGQLNEAHLHGFAKEGSFDKVTLALSLMSKLPLDVVERAFVRNQPDQLLVLAKALDLSWVTTTTLLFMQASASGSARPQLDQHLASFSQLQPRAAQSTLQSYLTRRRAAE